MADNPVLETVSLFYPTPEESELKEPTETDDVTKAEEPGDDQDTIKNTDEPVDGEEVEAKTEETESEDESETTEDQEQESVYLELDGKEIDLDEVRTWRDGHLMQSDYTRKTTEIAEQRKVLAADIEQVKTTHSKLLDVQAELQALIQEDETTNWEELREYDPEKYIEAKERIAKRKEAAEKFKKLSVPTLTQDELKKEQELLFSANPGWLDAKGNQTKAMKADSELLSKYWQDNGFTEAEIGGMYRSRFIEASLKAAKFDQLQADSKKFVKKAKKATLVTKPKAQGKKVDNKPKSYAELIYNS